MGTLRHRDQRIDIVRGLGVSMVVAAHFFPIRGVESVGSPAAILFVIARDFVLFDVLSLAVPILLLTSMLLFFEHQGSSSRRLLRLAEAFTFWVTIQYVAYFAVAGWNPSVINPVVIALGGPSLQGQRNTALYFLFDLMLLTLVAAVLVWIESRSPRAAHALAWATIARTRRTSPRLPCLAWTYRSTLRRTSSRTPHSRSC